MEPFVSVNEAKSARIEHQLSSNTEAWPAEIQTIFEEMFPQLASAPVTVSIDKLDPKSLSGIGRLILTLQDKEVIFPVIVKGGKLKPLDVMIVNKEYWPATEARVNALLAQAPNFTEVSYGAPSDMSSAVIKSMFPPIAVGAVAQQKLGEKLLDRIATRIPPERLKLTLKLLKEASQGKGFVIDRLNAIADGILKIAEASFMDGVTVPEDADIVQVRRDGDNYYLYFGYTQKFLPLRVKITVEHLKRLLSPQNYNKIFTNPFFYSFIRRPVYEHGMVKILPASRKFDFTGIDYPCKADIAAGGKGIQGYIFNLMSGPLTQNGYLFYSPTGIYTTGPKIYGIPTGKNDYIKLNLPSEAQEIMPGDMIAVIAPNVYKAYIFGPVLKVVRKHRSVDVYTADQKCIEINPARSGDENTSRIVIQPPVTPDEERVYIEDPKWQYIFVNSNHVRRLKQYVDPDIISPDITMRKIAVKRVGDNHYALVNLNVSSKDVNVDPQYIHKLAEKAEISSDHMTVSDLAFVLAHVGVTEENLNAIVKNSSCDEWHIYTDAQFPEPFDVEKSKVLSFHLHKIADVFRKMAQDRAVISSAATIDDSDTLDKILALNVVTPETLTDFINAIPEFASVLQKLSKMLIMARLGAQFNEHALEKLTEFMDDVVHKLTLMQIQLQKKKV